MLEMQRNIWLVAISIIVVLVLLNNTAYYFLTKKRWKIPLMKSF